PDAVGDHIAEQFSDQVLLPLVADREHNQISGKRLTAAHARPLGHEAFDVAELHQSDLAFDDQIRAADVEVVAAPRVRYLNCQPVSFSPKSSLKPRRSSASSRSLSIFRAVCVNAM